MSGITAILVKYLIGLVGITIVVVIHEIGHLVTAKLNGIDVEIFSFGLGPKLLSTHHKGTEYRISLFPLGGYCRLKGSDDLSQALIYKQKQFTHTEEGSLFSAHPARRILTYLSGPVANLLFAAILYAILASIPTQIITTEAVIATTSEYPTLFKYQVSPAYEAGMRKGDRIIALNGKPITDWQDLEARLAESKGLENFTISRDDVSLDIEVRGVPTLEGGFRYGLTPIQELKIGTVRYGSPEYQQGLKKGDVIVSVAGIPVENQLDLLSELDGYTEDEISITVENENKEKRTLRFIPNRNEMGAIVLGFSLEVDTREGQDEQFNLLNGIRKGLGIAQETITSLRNLISRRDADIRSEVTGIARSALMIGDITTLGFENNAISGIRGLLYLMGVVSISLAVVNLLPIPAFDGGQIIIATVEWITRKQMQPRTYYYLQLIGVAFVIVLFLVLTLADVRHFLALRR
ncbi:RIP metalloprotease RseP [Sphaerochaeta halotolerans]|jgi:regulator of sigma E protease|uniref:Zinc metalloprotease n=1 Tax=Sphaerochaeta halotolerans TaxID=2293840 RepID=A0A372MG34_9SPIR|nr:RIP metalloprotease RseP [Sphaerochaeta halotolerans]MBG0767075.1 RIP metalloprotease RseP [Spirochaetaceae bacterium]MDK2858904.1 regulator of sigma protease [Sphaerochaeta sp.]MDN5332928.1 regulator of sigma protease [Sphaerochaeta sp.]MXI87441.1 RIP metalloprotease RseP [Sphaerochaeta halotolerans]RFU94150.1 RIP metalloprotease RseP [Sphaerochaeta halotolerans]